VTVGAASGAGGLSAGANELVSDPNTLFSLAGKTALITGGSRGIGFMIAQGFVQAGASVYIAARKAGAAEEAAESLRMFGSCVSLSADLSTEKGCEHLAELVAGRQPKLDILVNNAGAAWGAPIEGHDSDSWDRVLALNLKGTFLLTKHCLPLLRAAGTRSDPARVINIGSGAGIVVPDMETYSYAASKAGVHHLTKHLANQLAPTITVNAIAPGPFPSKMMAGTLDSDKEKHLGWTLLGRLGRPDDVAGAAIFLSSRAGAYVTGVVLPVDGGFAVRA
jgi:NAD(P)-dependent dehydrogenase (short-subunit alcohol dehydrogenase family)